MAFNLFANIDNLDEGNYSYCENNIDDDDDVVVELPKEEVSPKAAAKSKKPKGKGRASRGKSNQKKDCSDLSTPDDVPVAVVPGVGQKTAFKKLSKLKESLATTAVADSDKFRTRAGSARLRSLPENNVTTQHDSQTRHMRKRSRIPDLDVIHFVDESPLLQKSLHSTNTNDSFDDDELNINIKIKWEGTSKVEKVAFGMYKTFNELIDQLSKRDKIDAKSFLLMFEKDLIKPSDSPHSIGYTLGKFVSVRVLDNPYLYFAESSSSQTSQANTIEVKIQSSQWKKPMICNIKLTDPFKVLTGMCSEKLKCHPNKIRFKFDGDILSINSTPEELEFEGGEIVDLVMSD